MRSGCSRLARPPAARSSATATSVSRRGAAREAEIFTAHLALLDDDALLRGRGQRSTTGRQRRRPGAPPPRRPPRSGAPLTTAAARARRRRRGRRAAGAGGARRPRGATDARGRGRVVSDELTPRDTAALDPESGAGRSPPRAAPPTAHAAILARALGLPAVVGLGPSVLAIEEGTPVLLDGDEGTVLVEPSERRSPPRPGKRAEQAAARRRAARERARRAGGDAGRDARGGRRQPRRRRRGRGGRRARRRRRRAAADGVPVPRAAEIPSEQEQVQTLAEDRRGPRRSPADRPHARRRCRQAAAGASRWRPRPTRSWAAGACGCRSQQPELLAVQLRAICRVAAERPLEGDVPDGRRPRPSSMRRWRCSPQARAATGAESARGRDHGRGARGGAAAPSSSPPRVDFFSIGTNDLHAVHDGRRARQRARGRAARRPAAGCPALGAR